MTQPIPSRITFNENLAKEFMLRHGIESSYPPIHEQLQCTVINRSAIAKAGYNPSIIKHNGRLLMSYRWHHQSTPSTALRLAELDEQFNVKSDMPIEFNPSALSTEDGRLFSFKGELYLSYVETQWPVKLIGVIKYGMLIETSLRWKVLGICQPEIGNNDGSSIEKNWCFFEHNDELFCLYSSYPEQIVYNVTRNYEKMTAIFPPKWPYGPIRGGCITPYDGKLLHFFHSAIDSELPPWRRRYFMGACLMKAEPPFQVLKISKRPIAIGSEICDLMPMDRDNILSYKGNVIFPLGMIQRDGCFLVSAGVNDSSSYLLKIKPENLNL